MAHSISDKPQFSKGQRIKNYRGQVGLIIKIHPPDTMQEEMHSWGYTVEVNNKLQVWVESLDELELYEE